MPLYWDTNGTATGSADSTSGTWGTSSFWNTDSTGGAGGAFQSGTTSADDLFFSAGSNATGANTITISGARAANSLTFSNGTVTLAGTSTPSLTLGTGGLTMASTLDGPLSFNSTLTSVILSGSQTWANNSAQSFSLSSSTAITGSATAGGTYTLTVGGSGAGGTTIAGIIGNGAGGGTLALVKSGTGTLTLSGANTFSGTLTVAAGTLSVASMNNTSANGVFGNSSNAVVLGSSGNIGTIVYSGTSVPGTTKKFELATGGTGAFDLNSANVNVAGTVSGAGNLVKSGTSLMTMSAMNTYTGSATVTGGTLKAGTITSAFGNNSAVTLANTAGVLLNLNSQSNSIGSLAGGGTNGGDVTLGNATLTTGGDGTSTTYAGVISGASGAVVKTGSGTFILTGSNTYTGATTISAGTLQLGDGVTDGSIAGAITDNAALVVNSTVANTISTVISGSGSVTKTGLGTLTLGTGNTFTGTLAVTAGTVSVTALNNTSANGAFGNSANDVTLGSAGGGIGTILYTGTSSMSRSKTFNLVTGGSGRFQLDSGALTLSGTISGGGALVKSGTSVLTLSGANTYTGATTVTAGTLKAGSATNAFGINSAVSLANSAGVLLDMNDNSSTLGSLSGGGTNGGNVYLGAFSTRTLSIGGDGTDTTYAGVISGTGKVTKIGAGILKLTGSNTYTGATTISAGTLQLGDGVTDGSIVGTITDNAALVVNSTVANTISTAISGSGSVTKTGLGTLTLSGANTFSGTLTVAAGTVSVASMNNTSANGVFGNSSNAVVLGSSGNTGTIVYTGTSVPGTTKKFELATGGTGAFDLNSANVNVAGIVSGAGNLVKSGTSLLNLSASNTYTGSTTVTGGTLKAGTITSAFGNNSAVTLANAAGVLLNLNSQSNSIGSLAGGGTNGGDVTLGTSFTEMVLTLGGDGTNTTFAGAISGTGRLVKTGAGTMILSGSNTYTGSTTISGGTIQLGDGTLNGSVTGSIVNNSVLAVNSTGANTISTAISGSGSVTKTGLGTLTLLGANVFTGLTTVSTGTLQLGNGTTDGSLLDSGSVQNNATLLLNVASSSETGAVSGTGSLTKTGAGEAKLWGAGNYSGATTVTAGTLTYKGAYTTGHVSVSPGASLNYGASSDAPLTISGDLNFNGGSSTFLGGALGSTPTSAQINVTGAAVISGTAPLINIYGITGVTPVSGTYTLLHGGTGSSLFASGTPVLGNIYNMSNFVVGALSGTATDVMVQITAATALTEAYWTGGLAGATSIWSVSNGTSASNWVSTLGGGSQALVPGTDTLVVFSNSTVATAPTATTLGADMSIKGLSISDTVNGLGLLADGKVLTVGTLGITMSASVPASFINADVLLGGSQTWTNQSANALTVAGAVKGSAVLTKDGTGTVILSGANTYSGITAVNAGTLEVRDGALVGSAYTIADGSKLRLNYATGVPLDFSKMSGAGTLSLYASSYYDYGNTKTGDLPSQFTGRLIVEKGRFGFITGTGEFGGATAVEIGSEAQLITWGRTYTVPITISGVNTGGETNFPAAIRSAGGVTAILAGTVTLAADSRIMAQASSTLNLNGALTGAYQADLYAEANAKIVVTPATGIRNSYGSTKISGLSTGTVQAGNAYALSSGGLLMDTATLKLMGYSFDFANLSGTSGKIGNYDATTASTLSVGADNTDTSFAGTLVDGGTAALNFAKTGTGRITLTGTNTYTGATVINGGSVRIGDGTTDGSILNTSAVSNAGQLELALVGTQTFSKTISGTGTLVKSGSGNLTLSGSNTYTGTTVLNAGSLVAGNALAFGGLGSLQISGGSLDLSGQSMSVGALSLGSAGVLNLSSASLIASTGNVTLGGTVNVSGSVSPTTVGRYTLLTSSALSGTFVQGSIPNSTDYYLKSTGTDLLLQRFAEAGAVTATPADTAIITGGSTAVGVVVGNSAPSLSDALSFTVAGSSNMSGTASGSGVAAGGTGSASAGVSFTGTSVGAAQSGTLRVTGVSTSNGPVDASVTVNVYDHASPTFAGGTFAFGNMREGYAGAVPTPTSLAVTNAAGYRADLKGSALAAGGISLGSLSTLAAGQTDQINATLSDGVSAGSLNKSFVYTFADDSTLSGALANVGTATVYTSGGIYRKAVGGVDAVSLGAIRAGETFGTKSVAVRNTASADGYSDDLVAAINSTSAGFSFAGSTGRIAGGTQDSTSLTANYTGSTANAGAIGGTASLSYLSNGQLGTGLTDTTPTVATESVTVTGKIYRLAAGVLSTTAVDLGNVRAGSSFGTGTVVVTNTAANDGYSDRLQVTQIGDTSGFSILNGSQTLSGGEAGSLALGFASTPAVAGAKTGTISFGLSSVGQDGTGLADVALASQSVTLTGTVYRAGSGVLASNTVSLGNIREGETFGTKAISVSNGATNDGYSEKLNVSLSGASSGVTSSGTVSLLGAGSTSATALQVGISNTATAGAKSGSVTVAYETDGTGTSGIASESVGTATVQISGTVYRKAVGTSDAVDLGAIREGGSFASKAVTIRNTASADGYSDDLIAAISSTGSDLNTSGSTDRISAGSLDSSGLNVRYSGSTTAAGTIGTTASISYTSKGQVATGLGDATPTVPSETIAVSGRIYRLATGSLSATTVDLGRIHSGSTFQAETVQISNSATNDGYSDALRIDSMTLSSGLTQSGTAQTLAAAQTALFSLGYDVSPEASGLISGTVTYAMSSIGKTGTGLSDIALPSQSVTVSGQVYTGHGVWTGSSTGHWSDWANWTVSGGRPGLDGALSRGNDSAVFNSPSALSVLLPSQWVELKTLDLLGSGGIQLLKAPDSNVGFSLSGSAAIHSGGGTHLVDAPIRLVQTTTTTVDTGTKLTLSGVLSGDGGITKLAGGTLLLSAANTYTGQTIVTSGRLELGLGALPGTGRISLASGTQMAFHLNSDLILPNTIIGAGSVISLNPQYHVFWNGGSTAPPNGNNLSVYAGNSVEFSASALSGDGVLYVNSGTLKVMPSRPIEIENRAVIQGSATLAISSDTSFSIHGAVSGSGMLIKELPGTLALSGSNTYSGGTEVRSGTLQVESGSALGVSGVWIGGTSMLAVNSQNDMTLSNHVSGPGELLKTGVGRLTLTGANTQVLGTRIREGAVSVDTASAFGGRLSMDGGTLVLGGHLSLNLPVSIVQASTFFVDSGGQTELVGTLGGGGDLKKSGAGKLTVSGSGSLLGNVVVQQGTLKVSNAQTLAKVSALVVGNTNADQSTTVLDVTGLGGGLELGAGQMLKGRGIVLGKLGLTGATLAPGNSIDVQKVQGQLSLKNAIYQVEYTTLGTSRSDRIEVTAGGGFDGSVLIDGTVVAPIAEARLADFGAHRFTILKSEGGVTGRFSGVAQTALVRTELVYGDEVAAASNAAPSQVQTIDMIAQRALLEKVGRYGKLREVGRGLDLLVGSTQADFVALYNSLDAIPSGAGVQAVLAQLSPSVYAELTTIGMSRMEDLQRPVSERLNVVGASSLAGVQSEYLNAATGGGEWTAWTTGFVGASELEANAARGFSGYSRNESGDVTGVEHRFGKLSLGLMGAGSRGSADVAPGSKIKSDSWHLGGYAALPLSGRVFADISGFYGESSNEITRTQVLPTGVRTARAEGVGQEWLVQSGIGMRLSSVTNAWSLVPTARLACMGVANPGFTEKGAGAFGIQTERSGSVGVMSQLAVQGSREWSLSGHPVRFSGDLEWAHHFCVDPRKMGVRWNGEAGTEWTITSEKGLSDAIKLGVSLEVGLSDRKTMRISCKQDVLKQAAGTRVDVSFSFGF